jgi:hypothetical protein
MTRLTEADLREDARRRATSAPPEVIDDGYQPGHVDFTPQGCAVHREVIRAIHGDDLLARSDAGFNLDSGAGRFDVYAVSTDDCRRLMEAIEADGDAYTGAERTRFIGRGGPTAMAQWRPNRFVVRQVGYHGVLHFVSDAAGPGALVDGAQPGR